ncbi:MAG TPA: glycosyltransferase [Thermoanaerobaculia bacterium]|nr:glycosyltransferase [Thermoanaerobaculia bacterium]
MKTPDPESRPALSVVIPAYNSHETIGGCLEALSRQTFRSFEVIVVDSGPDGATQRMMERFPWVRYERSERRLLPHAARNRGVELARGTVLVFTDPDIYAHPDWLERLAAAHLGTGEVIVGALACYGDRWLDHGIHLCKFSKWLPGGPPREVDMSPTANMLLPRSEFEAAGGLPGDEFLGDVTLSRTLNGRGRRLRFAPDAVVEHHHVQSFRDFMTERYTRGKMHGDLRLGWLVGRRAAALLYLSVTVLPVRLPRILALVGMHAGRAGQTGIYLKTLPLVVAGHAASLAGEAVAYLRRLAPKLQRAQRQPDPARSR